MFKVFPAIDIKDGKCVRLNKGDFSEIKIYNEADFRIKCGSLKSEDIVNEILNLYESLTIQLPQKRFIAKK